MKPEIKIDAVYELKLVEELIPDPRNARTHSDAQIAKLAGIIKEFGWTSPVIVDDENGILAGHGRVMAARKLGMDKVPCAIFSHLTDTQKRAYMIADNKSALDAGWDDEILLMELTELGEIDTSLQSMAGFEVDEIAALFDEVNPPEGEDVYSRKIEAPIYEPRGIDPKPAELYDNEKTEKLVNEIKAADLPEDIASFLERAAERHTVFNFESIADFYANADGPVQRLMEKSALVIIDFDKAIENGFVKITEKMGELSQAGQSDE